MKTTAAYILSQRTEPGLYFVLKDILDIELDGLPLPPRPFEGAAFVRLLQLLKTSNLNAICSALTPLLGSGAGLTPAGDDLILGLLLAYRRWGSVIKPAFDLAEMNVLLSQAASQKTTLISANLISCASQGQADERLIQALDGIMTGNSSPHQCARYLLNWGSSSGAMPLSAWPWLSFPLQPTKDDRINGGHNDPNNALLGMRQAKHHAGNDHGQQHTGLAAA